MEICVCMVAIVAMRLYVVVCLWIEYYKWVDRTATQRSNIMVTTTTPENRTSSFLYRKKK